MSFEPIKTLLPFVYCRGKVCPSEQATVSLGATSLQYGLTCFGGMRGYYHDGTLRLFRLRDHYLRLKNSCRMLGFAFEVSYEDFHSALTDLIKQNAPTSGVYIRPFVYSADECIPPRIDGLHFDLGIFMAPFSGYFQSDRGLRLMISSWRKVPDNVIPTKAKAGGAYLNSALATADARRAGYDEALLADSQGFIAEASVANLIVVYRGKVIVPPLGSPLLEGITMRTALTLIEEMGRQVHEERLDRSLLYSCEELILTGTAAQMQHAESVDGRLIGEGRPGPLVTALSQAYNEILELRHPHSAEWVESFSC